MGASPSEPVDGAYTTPRGRRIAADAVSWVATRSGGPGGQHANTSDTAVTVTIDVARTGLPEVVRARLEAAVGAVVTASSSQSRSQWRNRQLAWQEAMSRLDAAAAPPPAPRARTRPSRGAREARLRDKRAVGERKQARRRPLTDD
ncbi:MAG: aminoacyl-tRNA hydrolase [Ilumatobacteraceae bacterium]|jgi:ribosome-associated protein|nr:aminoacyl-tRNA hydrolase [Acidimicrobiaceae bacterium]MBP6487546.1 aminoacyl-tRNA hydrolase [Ilumatobacteraceae bacterium]MBK9972220.1 aminoacyl-tRNA hydrolase [Acidimicrobiaceae bacterium]MBP7889126.1 aminoacyl-tRNA hydrolase [Ilumatobacteraceae bacterium]MBP8208632.1 aminoacyl-tRNA hydrolase [Ilumatobacteraceae bacterium]